MADDEVEEQMHWKSRRTPPKRPRHRHSSAEESSSWLRKPPTTYDECTQTLLQVPPDTPESAALKLLQSGTHPDGSNLPGGPDTPAAGGSSLRAISSRSGAPPSAAPTRSSAVAKEESGPRSSETMIGMMKPKDAATGAQPSASSASKEHAKPAVLARGKVSPAGQGSGSRPPIPTTDQTVAAAAAASALGVGWRTPEMSGCAKFCNCMFTTAVPSEVASAVVDATPSVDPRSKAHRRRAEAPDPESFKFEEVPPELQEEGPPAEPRKFFWSRGVNTTLTYICGGRIEKHAPPPPTPPEHRPAEKKEESQEEMDVGDGAPETGSDGASKA